MNPIRLFEKAKAQALGYFWLPCPICKEEFGGHEWRDINGLPSSFPDIDTPRQSSGICPNCTRAGYGYPYEVSLEIWESEHGDNLARGSVSIHNFDESDAGKHVEVREASEGKQTGTPGTL